MALNTYQDDILDSSMDGLRQYTEIVNGNGTKSFRDDTVYTQRGSNFGAADINAIIDAMYPVGSIYMSVNNVSPATFFGGTWEQITDRFLLCAGSNHAAGTTGGAETDQITTGGTVGGHALTTNEMPSHYHFITRQQNSGDSTQPGTFNITSSNHVGGFATAARSDLPYSLRGTSLTPNVGRSSSAGSGDSHNHSFTGSTVTVDTMPPYLAVYCWKRTA